MSNKDYYSILNIDKNATEDDIKKSYKKLALQYHPDKNQGDAEACEKFKVIAEAYSVLINPDKRRQYDMMGSVDDNFGMEDPFSVFNDIFKQHINTFMNMKYDDNVNIGNIFSNISGMPESSFPFGNIHVRVHTFPTDVFEKNNRVNYEEEVNEEESPNINLLFNNLFKNKFKKDSKKEKILYNKPDDIIYNVSVSLKDIYNLKTKKLTISRMRKKDGKYIEKKKKIEIPIYGKEILLENEGNEVKDYKERGNILINIFNNKDNKFKRINDYDILTTKEINVNQLYTAVIYDIILPNGEVLTIQSENIIEQEHLIQKIINKGLPYKDDGDETLYGNLYIMYKIIFPKKFDDLKNIEEYIEKATINETKYIAYNCNIDELFKND